MADLEHFELVLPNDTRSASQARRALGQYLQSLGLTDMVPSAELVITELVANAVLHTDGPVRVGLERSDSSIRILVWDQSPLLPVVPNVSPSSMTGRGLLLVRSLASDLGFEAMAEGKVVWAEISPHRPTGAPDIDSLIDAWADDLGASPPSGPVRYVVELGDVPTDLLLAAKSHVDNLVREFLLAARGAETGASSTVPPHLAELIDTVVRGFADARLSIKRQALEASRRELDHVQLRLELGREAVEAGEAYLRALDEADLYCRAARLLTLETPPEHRVFRHWYVGEITKQLRRADSGLPPVPPQRFEDRLLQEMSEVAQAWAAAERGARLYSVSAALAGAMSPEAVAQAVLGEGAAALRASGGGLLLKVADDRLSVSGTVGYDEHVVATLNQESPADELPGALALRTGESVWVESREERDQRFPDLVGFERDTVSMCAVPLRAGDRLFGALRFSFSEPRLFDEDERRFVTALAAQAAQALDRAQLYQERSDLSRRLQRSLLPPALPHIPGLDVAAAYQPLGNGMELGGDFYDMWPIAEAEWAFALGDVCGKGPEAAAVTALVRYSLRAITGANADLVAVVGRLNDVLLSSAQTDDQFSTVMFGTIRMVGDGARMEFVTGGHPGPVVQRASGELSIVNTEGTLLGAFPVIDVRSYRIDLAPGDRVVLYTDGVTEARSAGVMFGSEGLLAVTRGAPVASSDAAAIVEASVLAYSGGVLSDDLAVLIIRKE